MNLYRSSTSVTATRSVEPAFRRALRWTSARLPGWMLWTYWLSASVERKYAVGVYGNNAVARFESGCFSGTVWVDARQQDAFAVVYSIYADDTSEMEIVRQVLIGLLLRHVYSGKSSRLTDGSDQPATISSVISRSYPQSLERSVAGGLGGLVCAHLVRSRHRALYCAMLLVRWRRNRALICCEIEQPSRL